MSKMRIRRAQEFKKMKLYIILPDAPYKIDRSSKTFSSHESLILAVFT
jgi:hypothetical protein